MEYKEEFLTDLLEINQLIADNDEDAIDKFKDYIEKVCNLGRFSIEKWNEQWRLAVYDLGMNFKKKDPVDFLKVLYNARDNKDKDQLEVIDFFKSEIILSNQPYEDTKKQIEEFISTYPYNPEFRHDLGHCYSDIRDYPSAITQYKFALTRDPENENFCVNLFNSYTNYIEEFIENENYQEGLYYCDKVKNEGLFHNISEFHNILFATKKRIKDFISIENKVKNATDDFREVLRNESNRERLRLIEILGFFSAIIAFIFATVSIGGNFEFQYSLYFMISLGLILILFLLVLNILFTKNRRANIYFKILILIIISLTLLLVYFYSSSVSLYTY